MYRERARGRDATEDELERIIKDLISVLRRDSKKIIPRRY